jgi:hypothetical protein
MFSNLVPRKCCCVPAWLASRPSATATVSNQPGSAAQYNPPCSCSCLSPTGSSSKHEPETDWTSTAVINPYAHTPHTPCECAGAQRSSPPCAILDVWCAAQVHTACIWPTTGMRRSPAQLAPSPSALPTLWYSLRHPPNISTPRPVNQLDDAAPQAQPAPSSSKLRVRSTLPSPLTREYRRRARD